MPAVPDALHGRGLCYYYHFLARPEASYLCDSATAIYQQLLQSTDGQYFLALADTMPTAMASNTLIAAIAISRRLWSLRSCSRSMLSWTIRLA